eukprot:g583.t1
MKRMAERGQRQRGLTFLDDVIDFRRASRPEAAFNSAKAASASRRGDVVGSVPRLARSHSASAALPSANRREGPTGTDHNVLLRKTRSQRFDGPAECDAQANDDLIRVSSSKWLHSPGDVQRLCETVRWTKPRRIGPGFNNLGNTCFFNAVLQCLTYTAPLAEFAIAFAKDAHSRGSSHKLKRRKPSGQLRPGKSKLPHQDLLSIFCEHVCNAVVKKNHPMSPVPLVRKLQRYWRSYRFGRQEDAHECLRNLVEALQQNFLKQSGLPKDATGPIPETTLPHRVFGGALRSQLRCTRCNYCSNTFESFLDLSVEIGGASGFNGSGGFSAGFGGFGFGKKFKRKKKNKHQRGTTLHSALHKFTQKETLDRDNKWFCEGCNTNVRAEKQLTIRSAPLCLVIHMKRFTVYGSKQTQHIAFPERLNLGPYMSGSPNHNSEKKRQKQNKKRRRHHGDDNALPDNFVNPIYELYGVVVHAGHTIASGHYYAFVRNSNDVWYEMDDSHTRSVSINTVLRQQAYILFYRRVKPTVAKLFGSVPRLLTPDPGAEKRGDVNAEIAGIKGSSSHSRDGQVQSEISGHHAEMSAQVQSPSAASLTPLPPAGVGSDKIYSLQEGTTRDVILNINQIAETKLGLVTENIEDEEDLELDSRETKKRRKGAPVGLPLDLGQSWMSSNAAFHPSKKAEKKSPGSNLALLMNHIGISPGLRTMLHAFHQNTQKQQHQQQSIEDKIRDTNGPKSHELNTVSKVKYRHRGKKGLAEGNEEIELLSASGLLSARSGKLAQSIKQRKRVWMSKQQQFRIQRASEIRNDLGVSSWDFRSIKNQQHPESADLNEKSTSLSSVRRSDGLMELAKSMKEQQKKVRQAAMQDDRQWQRARRHDEWDREYDRGKLKKVKAKQDSEVSRDGGVRSGGIKKHGSNSQRFQRASALKHGNGKDRKGAVKDRSWVAPKSKNRKKKRREIGKAMKTSGHRKMYQNGGVKKGKRRIDSAKLAEPAKFTMKTW